MSKSTHRPPLDRLKREFPSGSRSLQNMLTQQASSIPDEVLYRFDGCTVTNTQATNIAARGAWTLKQYGVTPGDRIALICDNIPEFFEVFLGAAWLGAVTVPLNTAAKGEQLQHMLENSGAELLVAGDHHLEKLGLLDVSGLALKTVLTIGPNSPNLVDESNLSTHEWKLSDSTLEAHDADDSDPLVILYTSGTTGVSKGVVCSHAQYFWWAFHNADILELTAGDVLLTSLPLFHTNALSTFFQALITGSSAFFKHRFSVSGFLPSLRESDATVTYLLGAMVPFLLSMPPSEADKQHNVRVILAPGVPAEAAREFESRFNTHLLDGFASTESNFVIGSSYPERKTGTMGTVRPGFEAAVVDERGIAVPDGTPGELLLRADEPNAFSSGYFQMPEKTIETWKNLWLHTGDRVIRDHEGYFVFKDRIKDVIRRRGENISSFEVEQAICRHPAVKHVAVYPVQSELAEDEVMASLVLNDGFILDPLTLMNHCQPILSYFAIPRYVDIVAQLPTTENGKIKKFVLRETGITPTTWDRDNSTYVLTR
ncbi:ATP-dependent acyl-CoA ligase [Glutamicibacter sp. NPDC087344]|uniref:ATP-dependent acyl-CoA ligase n=1 Tax=Glutamicibacter sp. NPDC087344 TaxID=3363994 RepID=UPI00382A57A8